MNIEQGEIYDMINASRRPWEMKEYAGFKKQRLNPKYKILVSESTLIELY